MPHVSPSHPRPWLVALVPVLLLVVLHWGYGPPAGAADYAHYLLHADALAHGRPYAEIGYIYTERNPLIGPPAQPPGLPLTLAPVLALFGRDMVAVRLVMVVSLLAFVALAARSLAREDETWIAVAAAAMCGVAIELDFASSNVLSDLGFCALVWAVIWLADAPGPWGARRIAAVALVGLAAMSYRTAGAALVPSLLLHAALRPRGERLRAVLPVVIWGVLGGLVAMRLRVAAPFLQVIRFDVVSLLRTAVSNAIAYRFALFDALLYPFPGDRANDVYHVVALPFIAIGLGAWVRSRYRSFVIAFTVGYVAMLLFVPVRESRYLWPLFPVLTYGLLRGVRAVAGRLRASRPWPGPRVAAWSAVVLVTLAIVRHLGEPLPRALTQEPATRDLFAHLRQRRAVDGARVAFVNPRVLTWETGVPAMGSINAPPDTVLRELRDKRISYVVLGDLGTEPALDRSMRAAVAAHPEAFTLDYRNAAFALYRFRPDSLTGPAAGATAIAPPAHHP